MVVTRNLARSCLLIWGRVPRFSGNHAFWSGTPPYKQGFINLGPILRSSPSQLLSSASDLAARHAAETGGRVVADPSPSALPVGLCQSSSKNSRPRPRPTPMKWTDSMLRWSAESAKFGYFVWPIHSGTECLHWRLKVTHVDIFDDKAYLQSWYGLYAWS